MISTVTSKGQITLPAAIRKRLKIKTGDKIDFVVNADGQIQGRPVSDSLQSLANTLPKPKKRLSLEAMDEAIRSGASKG